MSAADGNTPLNLAGRLAKSFLSSKITALIMLALTLFGLMAISVTPRLYNPEIVVPAASIYVMRPGDSPSEIQNQVVRPLEALMASLKGVEHTYGYAVNDMGVVTVQFHVGANEEQSLLLLYNQLSRNMDRLPPGTMQPLVKSIGINDVPVLGVTLSSNTLNGMQLRELGERFLEQLRSVPDVGNSTVIGGQRKAVRINIDPHRLANAGLSMSAVIKLLKASNVVMPAGDLVNSNKQYALRVNAAFSGIGQLGDLIVGQANHKPVYLKDVATVSIGPLNDNQFTSLTYGPATPGVRVGDPRQAVTLAIGKRAGANAVTVANNVLSKLHQLERDALPQGVHVTVTRDYGSRANDAVNTLMEHLLIAIAVVSFILLFFLGWREAIIVTMTVPLTLFVVLGVGWMIGQTINRISLFALILSLGLMVDAAIVVIENIHRHVHHGAGGKDFGALLVDATNEIGNPTNIATIAVILAFVPMAFVSGMMGPFMRPIPINVPVAMIASLVLAYIVVPWTAYRWLKGKALKAIAHRQTLEDEPQAKDWLHRSYVAVVGPLLRGRGKRNVFFLVVIVLLVLSMLMPLWQFIRPSGMNGPISPLGVNLQMLPDGNVSTFTIEVDTPAGTALDATNRVALAVGQVLSRDRYVKNYETYLGRTGPLSFAGMVRGDAMRRGSNLAQIVVNIVGRHGRPHTSVVATGVWNALKPVRKAFPHAHIKLYMTPPGPPVRAQVLAELYGPNYAKLRSTAKIIEADFHKAYGVINIDDSVTATAPEYLIRVDQRKAMLAGVAPAQVAKLVHDYVVGADIGTLREQHSPEPVKIVVRLKRADRAWIQQIQDLTITNRQGKQVSLAGIVHIEPSSVAKPIMTRDQHPVVYVMGDMLNASPVYATLTLNKMLDNVTLPNGVHLTTSNLGFMSAQPNDITHYQLLWGGDMRLTLNVFRDLGAAFIVALVFIYLLLVAYYQSFMLPVIVMGAIPLTLIGIFPGHWLFHMPFNATSMIGFIALAGIVVRNSLLLIDFILEYRREGYSLAESVLEAGAVRFRPILLTALAIMFGSAIMVSDPVFGGLAISLIFGTFASTMLTLVVIPLMYYLWQRREDRKHPDATV
ncbi:efflux RND transporter permease subunit [Acidihalobacter ferrooxydans]|uniref:Transporter n=1 Tax=Acidihalobacter ferrooxydans TaxID=1765967 RepID=A0A1P8UJD0_9GAMM|nr:efflux RND transporter permease subunit [Acidihalobacter ferrooxydans]APZ43912.1 transporter [Acidihalobacter ferrooxydans]